ncbi:hypothetical protein [Anaerosporobacter faecicola]|uniref:hypothetical protein n=1 Tax=Anaerosporobacter faecicola TaxID=2718714 RepID=UPI00143C4A59|nr:hypothetical protein [Anaerosporobacter faecicola]
MQKVNGYIDIYTPTSSYALIVVIGIITYFIINAFHIIRVKKIDMTTALKARE